MWKEVIFIGIAVLYLLFMSFKYWGRQYKCIGLEEKYYRRLITDVESKEEQCRNIFENLFNVPFTKSRPDFLKNPKTNRNLELDGFNSNITTPIGRGVAFEYNGSQHYYYNPKYHKSVEEFDEQLYRDKLKRALCEKHRVVLITIPYTVTDLYNFIIQKIHEKELYYYIR